MIHRNGTSPTREHLVTVVLGVGLDFGSVLAIDPTTATIGPLGLGPGREVAMCQYSPAIEEAGANAEDDVEPTQRLSIFDAGIDEAERHKWIESEKAGRDLGDWAIWCWVKKHWRGFLRERWLQHLQGRVYWIELDAADFGLLSRAYCGSPLCDAIISRLVAGWENLDVILWALDEKLPLNEVISILTSLNINSKRIEFQLGRRLTQAS